MSKFKVGDVVTRCDGCYEGVRGKVLPEDPDHPGTTPVRWAGGDRRFYTDGSHAPLKLLECAEEPELKPLTFGEVLMRGLKAKARPVCVPCAANPSRQCEACRPLVWKVETLPPPEPVLRAGWDHVWHEGAFHVGYAYVRGDYFLYYEGTTSVGWILRFPDGLVASFPQSYAEGLEPAMEWVEENL